jgi:hypothetical protein
MKDRMSLLIVSIGLILFSSSCKDLGTGTDLSGAYSYTEFDLDGVQVAHGTLVLLRADSQLSGQLQSEEQVTFFEGHFPNNVTTIEIWEVAQYIGIKGLRAEIDGGSLRGEVLFNTGAGPEPRKIGTFRADRLY